MTRVPRASTRTALLGVALGGALALGLAACGSTATPTASPAAPASSTTSAASTTTSATTAAAGPATVALAKTTLGEVVVDAQGRTLYMYTKDTQSSGKSSCSGGCLTAWPPVLATDAPTANGVAGTLGTIDTADGKKQVTLNGWPLYTYAKDTKAGDTVGQNVGQVWFVLDQSGTPVKGAAATTTGS